MTSNRLTPEQKVIKRIAEVAEAISFQAGVGGTETAGQIVSHLSQHPDRVEAFLRDGTGYLIDSEALLRPEHGRLSWHAKNGSVVTPAELREHLKEGQRRG